MLAVPIADITLGGGAPVCDPALDHKWRQDHRDYLDKLAKLVGRRASSPVQTAFVEGRIVPSITQYAADHAVDLIVMCTHGSGGFQRFWLGGAAQPCLCCWPETALKTVKALVGNDRAAPGVRPEVLLPCAARGPARVADDHDRSRHADPHRCREGVARDRGCARRGCRS